MTVGGWIFFIFAALVILFICLSIAIYIANDLWKGVTIGLLIGLFLCLPVYGVFNWFYTTTASGARAIKTQESNFNKGIKRKVTVYDMEGDIIQEYEGKFDIEYDDDRILFDDENNLRHIIYYPTGTVIVDEIGE